MDPTGERPMKTFRWIVLVIIFTRLALAYQHKGGEFSYGFRVVSFDSKTKQWAVDFTAPYPQKEGKKTVIEVRITRFVLTCLVGKETSPTSASFLGIRDVCDLEVGRLMKRHRVDDKDYLEVIRGTDTLGIVEGPEKDRMIQVFNIVREELTFSHKYTVEEFAKP
jgi:hypothetical protein